VTVKLEANAHCAGTCACDATDVAGSRDEHPSAGSGRIEWAQVAGRTAVVRARAASPLKILAPHTGNSASWVFTSTYGGGLVAGDRIGIRAAAGRGTTCFLGTQASTKVYRASATVGARQALGLTIADDALCVVAPDPVTCFAGAVFEQRQQIDVAPGGSLVWLDWLTSGRRARGERWAFARYESRTDVYFGGRHVLRNALLLDPADGPLGAPFRMGRLECLATVLILGDRLRGRATEVLSDITAQPPGPAGAVWFSASPLAGGALVRVAGIDTEAVGRWMRHHLTFVPHLLGADPWARKM
jgi:urease accessory protein